MRLDEERFNLVVELRSIAADVRDDHLNDRLEKAADKVDAFIRKLLYEEVES